MEHTSTKKRTVGTFQRYEKLKYTICISPMAMHLDECKCYFNRDMYWLVGIDNLLASCMKSWRICTAAKTHEAQTRHQLWCSKNMHTIVKNIHNYMQKICYIYIYQYIGCLMRFIPIFEPIFSLSGMWLLKPTQRWSPTYWSPSQDKDDSDHTQHHDDNLAVSKTWRPLTRHSPGNPRKPTISSTSLPFTGSCKFSFRVRNEWY